MIECLTDLLHAQRLAALIIRLQQGRHAPVQRGADVLLQRREGRALLHAAGLSAVAGGGIRLDRVHDCMSQLTGDAVRPGNHAAVAENGAADTV